VKICWDNLEGFYLSKNGNFRKNNNTYEYFDECRNCGDPYLGYKQYNSPFCSIKCATSGEHNVNYGKHKSEITRKLISENTKGKKNNWKNGHPMLGKQHRIDSKIKMSNSRIGMSSGNKNYFWKGGVSNKDLPLYDTFAPQLSYVEEIRLYLNEDNIRLLQIKCSKCDNWFIPSRDLLDKRISCLNGKRLGEGRLYCSGFCKELCDVYNKKAKYYINPKLQDEDKLYTKEELQIWSQEVLSRANHICEICGAKAEHAHHIQPKKLEPFFALDPENGLAVCIKCHNEYGHKGECSTGNLANKTCKGDN
jgi:hypothetical protein